MGDCCFESRICCFESKVGRRVGRRVDKYGEKREFRSKVGEEGLSFWE